MSSSFGERADGRRRVLELLERGLRAVVLVFACERPQTPDGTLPTLLVAHGPRDEPLEAQELGAERDVAFLDELESAGEEALAGPCALAPPDDVEARDERSQLGATRLVPERVGVGFVQGRECVGAPAAQPELHGRRRQQRPAGVGVVRPAGEEPGQSMKGFRARHELCGVKGDGALDGVGVHAEAEAIGVDPGLLEQGDAGAVLPDLGERVPAQVVGEHLEVAKVRDVRGPEGAEGVPRGGAVAPREVALAGETLEHEGRHPRIGVARLSYNLPKGLIGNTLGVEFTGPFDEATKRGFLTGAAGTSDCLVTETSVECSEIMRGLLPIDVDMERVEKIARAEYAGSVQDRIAVTERFIIDPIGIVRFDERTGFVVPAPGGDTDDDG